MADKKIIGNYQLGKTIGRGSFAKVKYAIDIRSGQSFAVKILSKQKVLQYHNEGQIKREIFSLKMIRHPNVVRLFEVLANKKRIYIVLEHVDGGELLDKIINEGKLDENQARKYFQQIVQAVAHCHGYGVYHRDLKLENILLDEKENVKVSDFGLSALPQHCRADGLLHTTCGSPNYVAPEVLANRGYEGAPADVWSCGVILYVLLTGCLPFYDHSLPSLYQKIFRAEYTCPDWISVEVRNLIQRILDPNPNTRITMEEIMENNWFKQGYSTTQQIQDYNTPKLDNLAFSPDSDLDEETVPELMNAFQLIAMSGSLDLSGFFEDEDTADRKTRFTSMNTAKDILCKIESTVTPLGFHVIKRNGQIKIQSDNTQNRKRNLYVTADVMMLKPLLHVIEIKRVGGDSKQYKELCGRLSRSLSDQIVCTSVGF